MLLRYLIALIILLPFVFIFFKGWHIMRAKNRKGYIIWLSLLGFGLFFSIDYVIRATNNPIMLFQAVAFLIVGGGRLLYEMRKK